MIVITSVSVLKNLMDEEQLSELLRMSRMERVSDVTDEQSIQNAIADLKGMHNRLEAERIAMSGEFYPLPWDESPANPAFNIIKAIKSFRARTGNTLLVSKIVIEYARDALEKYVVTQPRRIT